MTTTTNGTTSPGKCLTSLNKKYLELESTAENTG